MTLGLFQPWAHHVSLSTALGTLLIYAAIQIAEAGPGPLAALSATSATPISITARTRLLSVPDDALHARQLLVQDPDMSPFELARSTPLSESHHGLIKWMHEDLGQYAEKHSEVWRRRMELHPNGDKRMPSRVLDPLDELVCNRKEVRHAVDVFAAVLAQDLSNLSLADFHSLVSVFVTPDYGPGSELRCKMDVTQEFGTASWHDMWPTEAFLFTTESIGLRRMALSYGLRIHYLGLISHLDLSAAPHGYMMLPWEFLEHDLVHAWSISKALSTADDDWPTIHEQYERMRDTPGRTRPQRRMDDLVYFHRTHEQFVPYYDNEMVYGFITARPYMLSFLEKIAGPECDWSDLLKESIERITQFWIENVPSAGGVKPDVKKTRV